MRWIPPWIPKLWKLSPGADASRLLSRSGVPDVAGPMSRPNKSAPGADLSPATTRRLACSALTRAYIPPVCKVRVSTGQQLQHFHVRVHLTATLMRVDPLAHGVRQGSCRLARPRVHPGSAAYLAAYRLAAHQLVGQAKVSAPSIQPKLQNRALTARKQRILTAVHTKAKAWA